MSTVKYREVEQPARDHTADELWCQNSKAIKLPQSRPFTHTVSLIQWDPCKGPPHCYTVYSPIYCSWQTDPATWIKEIKPSHHTRTEREPALQQAETLRSVPHPRISHRNLMSQREAAATHQHSGSFLKSSSVITSVSGGDASLPALIPHTEHFPSDTSGHWICGVFCPPRNSVTPAGCPPTDLHPDTTHLEPTSDPTG